MPDLILALANGLSGVVSSGGHGGTVTPTDLQNTGLLSPNATQFLSSQPYVSSKPKAYLNWILFDEHFRYVGSSSGAEQVPDETVFGTTPNNHVYNHIKTDLPIDKNGYLYVYVSNETPNIPVFFDNLQVTHIKGPLTEETHYYPFGLTMSGISSKAAGGLTNKNLFLGKELQSKEFSDGSGLELYDMGARGYDQQTGHFNQQDVLADKFPGWSSYSYSFNNPLRFSDGSGMAPDDIIVLLQRGKSGHSSGHQAVLIGDDKNGWVFYSKDGAASSSGGGSSGKGHSTNGVPVGTLNKFANSAYNTFKGDYADGKSKATSETDSKGNVEQRFSDGFRITTDAATDTKMKVAAATEATTPYILGFKDCTNVAEKSLNAGGLKNGETSQVTQIQGPSEIPYQTTVNNYFPATKQAEIQRSNPGISVNAQLTPAPVNIPKITTVIPPTYIDNTRVSHN